MKMKKRLLSILLSLVMVLGLVPGMGLTAYAAPSETLLTTITATGIEQANYSTANVATVSFSYTAGGSSVYTAAWGWWGYGWTATVTPAEGYTITKCVFYDDKDRTATDSSSPFVVETTEEDKTPQVNGTPILAYTSKGIKKIEVYGYATPATTYEVTYKVVNGTWADGTTADKTETVASGAKPANVPTGMIPSAGYTGGAWSTNPADATITEATTFTYNFTATPTFNVTVSETPNGTVTASKTTATAGENITLTITPASGYQVQAITVTAANGEAVSVTNNSFTMPAANVTVTATFIPIPANTYTVTYVANNGSGDTIVRTQTVGDTHTVEGQLFAAPEGKMFDNWLGDDGVTYLPGGPITTTRTLTAQWKEEGSGSGADIVFNIPDMDNSWEYVGGGYAPQTAYRLSFAPMQGGTAYFVLTTGETGDTMNIYPQTTVRVVATPAPGYRLASIVWSMIDGSASYDITEAQTFVMPAMGAVVYVTFQPVA